MYNVYSVLRNPVAAVDATPVKVAGGFPTLAIAIAEAVGYNERSTRHNFYYPGEDSAPATPAPVIDDGSLSLSIFVDYADEEGGIGQVRLMGNKGLPVALVEEALRYGLMRELGYRSAATLASEGWDFNPEGPAYYDGEGDPEDESWVWDFNRADELLPTYTRP